MDLFLINPNSTAAMTEGIRRSAELRAAPATRIIAASGRGTPASIEGHHDEALAVPDMLAAIRSAEAAGAQATVIACFDDPGLAAAREVAAGPVIGIAQAAFQAAQTLSARFSVVTTLPRSVPIIEDLLHDYGAARHCRRVRSVNLPVLALEAHPDEAYSRLLHEARRAQQEDGAEAVVLGCAGMAEMCERLQSETGMPVIDGVVAAVKLAEAMVGAGYRTSKIGSFGWPRDKAKLAAE